MGTKFRIVLYAASKDSATTAASTAFARIAELDGIMSDYRSTSELMRLCDHFSKTNDKPFRVSNDLFTVLSHAQDLSARSDGAFDVSVGPLVRLWRHARRTQKLPDGQELSEAKARVGFEKIKLDPVMRTVRLTLPGMQLDLGGIAKGYAADEALKVLKNAGMRSALVAAGGDIAVSDAPPGESGWTIAIAPLSPSSPPRSLLLKNAAVSTSGDAEQFVEINGVRYSHIVDPRTGLGLTGRHSVTVVAQRGIVADSLTKAVMMMPPERALKLVEDSGLAAALIVMNLGNGEITQASKRFGQYLIQAGGDAAGWIDLLADNKLSAWKGKPDDWMFASAVTIDPKNPRRLAAEGSGTMLVNSPKGRANNLTSKQVFGDVELHAEFLIPKGSNSGIKFHAVYEIQIFDSFGAKAVDGSHCGGVYPRALQSPRYHHVDHGIPPLVNACSEPGSWQKLEVVFRAPRFDAAGNKVAHARIERAVLNGKLIHDNQELPTPTGNNWVRKEVPTGPLLLQGDHGPVAFRNIRVKPLQPITSDPFRLRDGQRILFLGDSNTFAGKFITYLDGYLSTRFPAKRFELINLGLPSETVSGLSEADHPYPRPNVHDRLGRALAKTNPDIVVACYGMNDGIYAPFNEERFAKYRSGIERLMAEVKKTGAMIVLMTPAPFDPHPIKAKLLPATADRFSWMRPFADYDSVLARYSEWLMSLRQQGILVADAHHAVHRQLHEIRGSDPNYVVSRDAIHPDGNGHWAIARALMRVLGCPEDVDLAEVDAATLKATRGNVTDLKTGAGAILFQWQTRLPMPADPNWHKRLADVEQLADRTNRHRLYVNGLKGERFELFEGVTRLDDFSREQFHVGIDLTAFPALVTNLRAAEIGKLVDEKQRLLGLAWLTDVGHQRPDTPKGIALDEAQKRAATIEAKVRELAAPVTLHLRVVPIAR
jgi:thiamine biosynthesis lipoprotein